MNLQLRRNDGTTLAADREGERPARTGSARHRAIGLRPAGINNVVRGDQGGHQIRDVTTARIAEEEPNGHGFTRVNQPVAGRAALGGQGIAVGHKLIVQNRAHAHRAAQERVHGIAESHGKGLVKFQHDVAHHLHGDGLVGDSRWEGHYAAGGEVITARRGRHV